MLRRFALLAVLLLTLSVVTPSVFACDTAGSCCPPGAPPCESSNATQWAVCCLEQPMSAPALAISVARELDPLDAQLPHAPGAPGSAAGRVACQRSFDCLPQFLPQVRNQQQLYLHTGRLRL
jgi:hypothetical protein